MKIFKVIACLLFPALLASCHENRATAEVLIDQLQPRELYETYLPSSVPLDPAGFLKSDAVAKEVAATFDYAAQWNLNNDEVVKKLRGSIQADFDEDTGVLKLSASNSNPQEASQIANSFAEAFCVVIEKTDRANRQILLESLQAVLLEQSDMVQDMRKDRTVIVQQYGAECFGELSDSAGLSEGVRFALARERLADLEGRKEGLVERLERYKGVLAAEPSQMSTAFFEETEKELQKVEYGIEKFTRLKWKSGTEPVDESLKKLMFQQAEQDYQYHWNLLNELRAEQANLRFLLKIIFKPATVQKWA